MAEKAILKAEGQKQSETNTTKSADVKYNSTIKAEFQEKNESLARTHKSNITPLKKLRKVNTKRKGNKREKDSRNL